MKGLLVLFALANVGPLGPLAAAGNPWTLLLGGLVAAAFFESVRRVIN